MSNQVEAGWDFITEIGYLLAVKIAEVKRKNTFEVDELAKLEKFRKMILGAHKITIHHHVNPMEIDNE